MKLPSRLTCWIARLPLPILAFLIIAPMAFAQMTPDQQAELLLNTARKAHNDKNYVLAAAKFREYVTKFPNAKEVTAARFGLALSVLDGPEKKYDEVRELMQGLTAIKDFPDRALANYYTGVALRSLGLLDLAQAESKPAEVAKFRASAQTRFNEAIPFFTNAITLFIDNLKAPVVDKKLTYEAEWAARARCEQAEMQLRVGKLKDVLVSTKPFVEDPIWSLSRYSNLGRYYHGYASVLLKDHVTGQKTLSMLTPFNDPVFGNHARYLLARTYHLADERAEATNHYEGTISDYGASKIEAANLLKQPQKWGNDPEMRARLEGLVKNPPPDHVARAILYLGVLHYEGGKFSDARSRFAEFVKQFPQSPLRLEAEMRLGYCQVQMKEYADAVKTLTPLVDKEPRMADQVLLWLAKAQAGLAPEASVNQQVHQQMIVNALNTFKTAAERAQKISDQDPEAKVRRAEILLEMADQMQRIWQNKEAGAIYNQLLTEKLLPERQEEIMQRLANALHLTGDHNEADKVCMKFIELYPQSTLLPAVLFYYAENSYFRILAAEKNLKQPERDKELPKLYEETIKRFQKVVEKFPEYPKINVARYSLGLTLYRKGDLPAAQKILSEIPGPERTGDLSLTSYLIGDCLMRQVPTTIPDDALAAGKMEEQLKSAAEQLEGYIGAQSPKDPNLADALIKYGLCQQRLAGLIAQPQERIKMYQAARGTYERLLKKEFSNQPRQVEQAIFERAKCIGLVGDVNTAINELRKFTNEPLRQSPVAPQAVLQLATYLRAQNKAPEAVDVLVKNGDFLEGLLIKDSEKGPHTIALLRYHQGVALRETGKLAEARRILETVVKLGGQRPEAAEAALRIGQCLKEEGQQRLEMGRKLKAAAKKPEESAQALKVTDEGYKMIRESVAYLEAQADQIKTIPAQQEVRGRMLYEAAWSLRTLAEPEIDTARTAMTEEMRKKLNAPSSKFPLPEVTIDKIPLQPSEKKVQAVYKLLIDQAGDLPIGTEARFELAELLSQRNDHDAASQLLSDVLDKEPSAEMTEKIRLRLGEIQAAKGNIKGALTQFDAIASNLKSPLLGWAHYRAGEALIQNKQYPEAIKRLAMFRDQAPWQNVPGLSDRALVRLGYAYSLAKSWDESRVVYERLVNAFPNSQWADEGRYGMGWALQQQKNYDGAANAYSQVVARTATELAAKAQLQIGLCRVEQKRYLDAANAFLVVPSTYDYPDLQAASLLEAGKAYLELKLRDQAAKQFERVVREFPNTTWAAAAKEKLDQSK